MDELSFYNFSHFKKRLGSTTQNQHPIIFKHNMILIYSERTIISTKRNFYVKGIWADTIIEWSLKGTLE